MSLHPFKFSILQSESRGARQSAFGSLVTDVFRVTGIGGLRIELDLYRIADNRPDIAGDCTIAFGVAVLELIEKVGAGYLPVFWIDPDTEKDLPLLFIHRTAPFPVAFQ